MIMSDEDKIEGQAEVEAQKPARQPAKKKQTRRTKQQMQAARDLAEAKRLRAEAEKLQEQAKVETALIAEQGIAPPVVTLPVATSPRTKKGDFSMDIVPEEGPTAAELKEAARLKKENQSHQRIRDEINIRRYVKKTGGWKKGVSAAQHNATVALLRKLGRDEPVWDRTIIPKDRYDGPMQTEAQIQETAANKAMEIFGGKSGR
jgi:hypothetical protein